VPRAVRGYAVRAALTAVGNRATGVSATLPADASTLPSSAVSTGQHVVVQLVVPIEQGDLDAREHRAHVPAPGLTVPTSSMMSSAVSVST
jgi:hypothetical protein